MRRRGIFSRGKNGLNFDLHVTRITLAAPAGPAVRPGVEIGVARLIEIAMKNLDRLGITLVKRNLRFGGHQQ